MNIKVIDNLEEFLNIKEEYLELYNASIEANVFIGFDWVVNIFENFFSDEDELKVISVWDKKKLVFILPLCIKRKKISFLEYKYLTHLCFRASDYCSMLIRQDVNIKKVFKAVTKAIKEISQTCDFIKIDNISSSEPKNSLFYNQLSTKFKFSTIFTNVENPRLIVNDENSIEQSQKKDVIRRRNKLKLKSQYEFCANEIQSKNAWAKTLEFHKQKFDGVGFNLPDSQRFYKSLNSESLILSTLKLDGEIVASHFGFVDMKKQKFYYYIPTYSKDMAREGVGMMLMLEIIEWCSQNNICEFDMLRGLENYKISWSSSICENKTFFSTVDNKVKSKLLYYVFMCAKSYQKYLK
ncbi:putative GNAT family N-acetyltransferase [Vibrio chagasii]|nr:putative GNAT family N-acetyltransferase [Vibrio chagasii]CAH7054492.1 putative GNAT family N-acetyltransferase [Vibrio chagasii]CAH7064480.1 putative GNAT family N-acetyltransferase [Vibrio chagasii]CAH7361937.1 putative GNAT family N-acetyltransferase [Vibrio chagasii]CAH7378011.1 putative GNAT family N-acetyltransferase [Vibrio chagasii]